MNQFFYIYTHIIHNHELLYIFFPQLVSNLQTAPPEKWANKFNPEIPPQQIPQQQHPPSLKAPKVHLYDRQALLPLTVGSVIIITGASSGLGKQFALLLCQRSLRLIITGRDTQRLNQTKNQCEQIGNSQIVTFVGDLTNDSKCRELIETTVNRYNRIDCLLLNAGINAHFQFRDLEQKKMNNSGEGQEKDEDKSSTVSSSKNNVEIFETLMRTNFYVNVNLTKLTLPHIRSSHGKIIVISSLSGKFGLPSRTAYCASKFALTGFFESLRTEEENIQIVMVYPTSLETPMRSKNLSLQSMDQKGKNSLNFSDIKNTEGKSSNPNEKREDPKQAAKYIIEQIDKGKKDIYIPMKGFIGVVLQPIFPNFIREKLKKAAKL